MKYIVNIIIFIVLWTVIAAILMAAGVASGIWSGDVTRPSSWPAVSGIISIILAYRLVKKINSVSQSGEYYLNKELAERISEMYKN